MAAHHRKAFLEELGWRSELTDGSTGHWRLLDKLPCLDAEHFGEELPRWKYEKMYDSDPVQFFRCLFKIHDGELLGVETEWQYGSHNAAFKRECIHVQYARNQSQHNYLTRRHFPGTQGYYSYSSMKSDGLLADELSWEEYEDIGETLVTRMDPPSHKKGKVVTWPQLFHLGALHNFTAMEIFGCGCHMELMMSIRQRPTHGRGKPPKPPCYLTRQG